jgi:uncharacterized protein (DUF3820 family)
MADDLQTPSGAQAEALVPFGKYKGRPVSTLLSDIAYLYWLQQQPWVAEKFGRILKQRITDELAQTPDHNKLQVLFLDPAYRLAFAKVAGIESRFRRHLIWQRERSMKSHSERDRAITARRNIEYYEHVVRDPDGSHVHSLNEATAGLAAARVTLAELEAEHAAYAAEEGARPIPALMAIATRCYFEIEGIDVTLKFSSDYPKRPWIYEATIEIKPTVADEYLAVLRQMKRNKSQYLFVGEYRGVGATRDQFVATFAASGITVVWKADVDAALSTSPAPQA